MGLSKTEVNLRRLLEAAPRQKNQAKLMHYVATMRELLEQLSLESTPDGIPRVSKAIVNEFSDKIEAIASSLAPQLPELQVTRDSFAETTPKESPTKKGETIDQFTPSSPGLRRRHVHFEERTHTTSDANQSASVKLDSKSHAHIEKHRKLQEDLTDEMVELAQQLKESTLVMSQSLKNTEKMLDSTEKAVEQSLAGTNRVGTRAMAIYSETSKTTCFTWLLMFVMTCVFIMVVLLIRVT